MVRTFAIMGVMLLALSLPQQAAGMNQKPGSSKLQEKSPESGSKNPGSPPTKASRPSEIADTKRSAQPAKAPGPPTKGSGPSPSKTSGPSAKAPGPPAKASKQPTKESGPPAKTSGPPAKVSGPPSSKAPGPPAKVSGPPPAKASTPSTKSSGPPAKKSGPPPAKASGPPAKKSGPPAKTSGPPSSKAPGPPARVSGPPPAKASAPPAKTSGPPAKKSGPPLAKAPGPPAKKSGPPPSGPPPAKASGPPPVKASGPPAKKSGPPPAKKSGPPPAKADTKRSGPPAKSSGPPPAKASGPPPAKAHGPPPPKASRPPPKEDTKGSRPPIKTPGPDPKRTDRNKLEREACLGLHLGDVCDFPEWTPQADGNVARRLSTPPHRVNGRCWKDLRGLNFCKPGVCGQGDHLCDDPHMQGLRGQHIDWSGVDGGWYCLVKDESADLHVNVRLTAPLPEEFPGRQLVTGVSVISDGNSLVVEVEDPYTTITGGCVGGDGSVCLANGGLRATVNGQEADHLLVPTRDAPVAGNIGVSSSNLPVECRQFGGDKLWARMYAEMLEGRRELKSETFEEWVLSFDRMAAPEWCAKYIAEHDLSEVQSVHAILKIMTRTVDVRLNAGFGHQGGGELDWDGRVLPDLEFWQMDIGLDGLDVDSPNLSGILGETARPVVAEDGHDVMDGDGAFRGSVEDYRVPGALGTDFALLA